MAAGDLWLDDPTGMSTDQLLALAGRYRIDSLVLAFESALYSRAEAQGLGALTPVELAILAIESLEREVNNGGYHQFFLNTPQYAHCVVAALESIGCPRTAGITRTAIELLGVPASATGDQVTAALEADPQGRLVTALIDRCDRPYDDTGEPIADRLFEYISAHRENVRIP